MYVASNWVGGGRGEGGGGRGKRVREGDVQPRRGGEEGGEGKGGRCTTQHQGFLSLQQGLEFNNACLFKNKLWFLKYTFSCPIEFVNKASYLGYKTFVFHWTEIGRLIGFG